MKILYLLFAVIAVIAVRSYFVQAPAIQDVPDSREYGKWKLEATPSDNGEVQPSFIISASQGYKDGKGLAVTPTLVVSCSHGSARAYFDFGVPVAKPKGELGLVWGRALVDGNSFPLNLDTPKEKPHTGLEMFAKDIVRRMSYGDELIVEINDALISPNRMVFDIRGFDRAVRPFDARCGIR